MNAPCHLTHTHTHTQRHTRSSKWHSLHCASLCHWLTLICTSGCNMDHIFVSLRWDGVGNRGKRETQRHTGIYRSTCENWQLTPVNIQLPPFFQLYGRKSHLIPHRRTVLHLYCVSTPTCASLYTRVPPDSTDIFGNSGNFRTFTRI